MIVACCSDGHIRFFHTREGTLLNEVLAGYRRIGGIICGCCSRDNLTIAVGDSVGFVRIFDVGFMQNVPQEAQVPDAVRTIASFFASREMITSVSLWEEKEMIIIGSADATASLWSFKGLH
jgi:WD40 repeat protein